MLAAVARPLTTERDAGIDMLEVMPLAAVPEKPARNRDSEEAYKIQF